ncbi:MAG TPA: TonB-dependent receptor, partial [Candidatus Sulfotelmatobacter sp.]|nr:TonB-dependent receptor [Candidatus Sulfotelmatobacter sp.]
MLAYELGYRIRPTSRLVLSLATFYQDYDDVHSVEPELANPRTLVFGSGLRANSWGVELFGTYQVTREWRLRGGYTYFDKVVWEKAGVIDVSQGRAEGDDPQNQFLLQSLLDLPYHLEFDLTARYVDTLPSPNVPSYFTFDARLAWKPRKNLELAIVGQNLWQAQHAEFGDALTRQEIPRSVYGKLTWWF